MLDRKIEIRIGQKVSHLSEVGAGIRILAKQLLTNDLVFLKE